MNKLIHNNWEVLIGYIETHKISLSIILNILNSNHLKI